jgi:diguanylate cyclase (GGDEF)-like protein
MASNPKIPSSKDPPAGAPLQRALGQSERVHDKVEQAAVDLSSVNAVLKEEVAGGIPLAKVETALDESEVIELHIQEAAADLRAVNDALAAEIDERHHLEDQLSLSDAALTESRAQERRSRHSALHDAVTGLPNLTLFLDRLANALAQADRHGWRLAVMFIDLDDFKVVNDTLGHDAGDHVLQVVAKRLQAVVRAGDTVGRRSGDEFLLLMLEAKDRSNVAAFAQRIRESLAAPFEVDGESRVVGSSIGFALYPEDGLTAQALLKSADAAMYTAKHHSKSSRPAPPQQ